MKYKQRRERSLPALYQEPHDQRRVATLYWKKGPHEAFFGLIRTFG